MVSLLLLRNATSEPRSVSGHGSCRGQPNVLPIRISNFLLAMDACMARVDYAQVAVAKNRCLQERRPRHAVASRSLGVDGHLTPTQFCCYQIHLLPLVQQTRTLRLTCSS